MNVNLNNSYSSFKNSVNSLVKEDLNNVWLKGDLSCTPRSLKTCGGFYLKKGFTSKSELVLQFMKNLQDQVDKHQGEIANDREMANKLLILRNNLNEKYVKGNNGKKLLDDDQSREVKSINKKIKVLVLNSVFKGKIDEQKKQVAQLRVALQTYETNPQNKTFLNNHLELWERSLAYGKPISIPMWYHATKPNFFLPLMDSEAIKVMKILAYQGAFVSTLWEEKDYGPYVIAVSDEAVQKAGEATPPITTKLEGAEHCLPGIYPTDTHTVPRVWAGFQNDIEIKIPNKKDHPLDYYRFVSFSMIGVGDLGKAIFKATPQQQASIDKHLSEFKAKYGKKIQILPGEQVHSLNKFVLKAQEFVHYPWDIITPKKQ